MGLFDGDSATGDMVADFFKGSSFLFDECFDGRRLSNISVCNF
jgi:hypothetical protein